MYDTNYPATTTVPEESALNNSTVQPSSANTSLNTVISTETGTDDFSSSKQTEVSPSLLPNTVGNSTNSHMQNGGDFPWRWLVGGILLFLLVTFVIVVLIKKYNPQVRKPKTDEESAPTQCSEDHARGPLFYTGQANRQVPHVPPVQQESNIPLLGNNPPQPPIRSRSSFQVHPEAEQKHLPLNTIDQRLQPKNCSRTSSTGNYDKMLASGADSSFAFGDHQFSEPLTESTV